MTVTYNIQNVTPNLAKTVMLRKFFQMVFMGNNRRSMHIYTATVIGASDQNEAEFTPETYVSNLGNIPDFRMKFSFLVGNSDNNEVEYITHEDITSGKHGFLDEISCIRKVWGDECSIILNDQKCVAELLAEIQKAAKLPDQDMLLQSAALSKHTLLWTKQSKNNKPRAELSSLSIPGVYHPVPDEQEHFTRDNIAKKSSYTIDVPSQVNFPEGLELVNWVRTVIQFKYEIDDNNLNYTLRRDLLCDDGTAYFAPDFTWYFSPVVKSYIDNHNSIVEVKRKATDPENECTCPIQKSKKRVIVNDKSLNCIDTVPNKMTVDFHHWTKEKIRLRQKYRLAAKEVLPTALTFDSLSEINIFLDTADEHSRGNRQFITSILLSFALAFGIDSSRLKDVSSYFGTIFPADVMWLALLISFSLALINTPVTQNASERTENWIWKFYEKHNKGFRKIALSMALVWFIIVFGILRVSFIQNLIMPYRGWIEYATRLLYWIIFSANCLYVILWKKRTDGRIWANLFGRDIL